LVELIKSARNGPLVRVFEEMPFTVDGSDGEAVSLSLDLNKDVNFDNVVSLDDSAFDTEGDI
jgi:hypothetical protein